MSELQSPNMSWLPYIPIYLSLQKYLFWIFLEHDLSKKSQPPSFPKSKLSSFYYGIYQPVSFNKFKVKLDRIKFGMLLAVIISLRNAVLSKWEFADPISPSFSKGIPRI